MTAHVAAGPRPGFGPGVARPLSVAALVVAWEALARLPAPDLLLARPVAVALHAATNAGLLARALATTLANAAWGFVLGNLAAMALATLVVLAPGSSGWAGRSRSWSSACRSSPWADPARRPRRRRRAAGRVGGVGRHIHHLPRADGRPARRAARLARPRALPRSRAGGHARPRPGPAALPYLAVGLQMAAPAAILGAMVGEFTVAERGLGVLTIHAARALDVDATWTIAALASGAAMAAYAAIGWLGCRLAPGPPPLLLAPPPATALAGGGRHALELAAIAVAALAAWPGVLDAAGLRPFFAKRPGDVPAFLATDPDAPANRATLLAAYGETLAFMAPGYLAGLALGAGLACAITLAPGLAATVLPLAVALRSIPIVTTAPLLVVALGRGAAGTVAIVAVMIFFLTLVACLQGLRQMPGQVIDVLDSYATTRLGALRLARLSAMLPAFFAAARMGMPAAILVVTTAGWLATGNGIGTLIALTASTSRYGMLWSAIVLVARTASAAYAVVAAVERAVLRIYAPEQVAR